MKLTGLLLFSSLVCIADSNFRFASYYGDHMVLQMAPSKAGIWGYAEVGAHITVSLFKGLEPITKKAVWLNEDTAIWKVILDPVSHGGPYWLLAQQHYKEEDTNITLHDILFGDVWLCSGQSNMEMTVSQIYNASKELSEAVNYPNIRLFTAALEASQTELQDLAKVDLQWSVPTSGNLGHGDFSYFSAVCWLFGRYLSEKLQYPIGLVESSWGGTSVEAWSSKRALKNCGLSQSWNMETERPFYGEAITGPCNSSILWNAMIHPLLNMTIKGAIWYQGEQNTNMNTDLYNCTFPALIEDWRKSFHEGSEKETERFFPFGFVQLSTYQKSTQKDMFPEIRWHQTADYGYVPNPKMINTFMAVAMDLCDEQSPYGSIHPRDKQHVAYRLYLGARAIAYGETDIAFQGPFPDTINISEAESCIYIIYDQDLLITKLSEDVFEVFCKNEMIEDKYDWVPAPVMSVFSDIVIVSLKGCINVSGIRYAWSDWPCDYAQCPFYSIDGVLPAPMFLKYF
ncbi:sialate O-acetylesterase [Bombina bombina]|uniref:sialate O-acetylesterase n=1 Tax=Bombina bombina TaxID=8345 RepID=UPI00235B25CE|nr:sialate O-acetylesterase [Bombina bombina]